MRAGVARVLTGAAGTAVVFVFWALVFPIGTMIIALYIARLFPLTGQWRKRLKEQVARRRSTADSARNKDPHKSGEPGEPAELEEREKPREQQ